MSWFGKLFGTEKVINKGVDMLDNAFYTDQEKAQAHIQLLKAYEPFKLAQRLLAAIVVPPWVLGQILCFGLGFTDIDTSKATEVLDGKLGMAALTILGFYFMGGTLNTLKK